MSRTTLSVRAAQIVDSLPEIRFSREFQREYEELGLCREDRKSIRIRYNSLEESIQDFYNQEYSQ